MAIAQWDVFIDPDDPEKIPHLIVKDPNPRIPTLEECQRACQILSEIESNVVRLSCRNLQCSDKGGWIERSRKDISKNIYHCQVCGKPMER